MRIRDKNGKEQAVEYTVLQCMHLKRQKRGFSVTRDGAYCYLFFHFINPVEIINEGRFIRTSSNACIIFTPGTPVYYRAEMIDMLHNFIHFQVSDPEEFASLGIPLNSVFYTDMQESITRDIEFIEWSRNTGIPDNVKKGNKLMESLFGNISAEQKRKHVPMGKSFEVVLDNLRSMIYISPADWSVESMANFVHLSRSHFSIKYKARFGISPNEDLTQAALLLAARYLTTSDMQIYDIAYECGFNSPEYFIRLFKNKKGSTPGKFRELYRKCGGDGSLEQMDVMPWDTPQGTQESEFHRRSREK